MSVFADFLDLRTAVVEQVGRPDIVDVFPRLTAMAETGFNRRLRTQDMITSYTMTLASGEAQLPTDLLEIIGLYGSDGLELIQQPVQVTQSQARPFYSIAGGYLTVKGYSGDMTLQYYARIPTISDGMTSTNWLLEKHPDVYLYGVGYEASKHIRNVDGAQAAKALLDMALTDAIAEDHQARYSRARVRVGGVTP